MGNLTRTIFLTVIVFAASVLSLDRFCNDTTITHFQTECRACSLNIHLSCPNGTRQLTTGAGAGDCSYNQVIGKEVTSLFGCRHKCEREIDNPSCCPSHWGSNCEECVGGADNECFGRGMCDDGYEGSGECSCLDNFKGTACEYCLDDMMYGADCNKECQCVNGTCDNGPEGGGSCECDSGFQGLLCDQAVQTCDNVTCGENSYCVQTGFNTTCLCEKNYEKDLEGFCEPIDSCLSSPCDEHAICESTGPAQYACTCREGYHGDGIVCLPIDRCQLNNGGCVVNTSACIYQGPGKHSCLCRPGYENYQSGVGCSMIDECVRNPNTCHKLATCKTLQAGQVECVCPATYIGDGKNCYGNILQQLEELNQNFRDPVTGDSLHTATWILKTLFKDTLTDHGPFTLFVPVDKAFKNILKNTGLAELVADRDRIRQIIYQHLIVGQLMMKDLMNNTVFYTLQGNSAELQARGNSFRFKLHGRRDKTRILRSDLPASNGIIHVVNSLLSSQPDQMGNKSKNLFDLIDSEGRHNRFISLIKVAGIESWISSRNLTIFTPNNGAFSSLSADTLDYLQSPKGREKLVGFLQNHMFNGLITAADLINLRRIKSLEGSYVTVKTSKVGRIILNEKAYVSQTNIPGKNGMYHHIEGLLLPGDEDNLLPNRCDKSITRVIRGACGPCRGVLKCPGNADVVMGEKVFGCTYWVKSRSSYTALKGCARMCNRTFVTPQCCPDFYGLDCKPCPGAFHQTCSGHGQCRDGYSFDGKCLCDKGFTGMACQDCEDKQTFGANCSQKCTCLYGNCDYGPKGTGKCKENSCADGYWGENCEIKENICGRRALACHAHSVCIEDDSKSSCVCKPGYEGNGVRCTEIDPCLSSDRGGCHPQATCEKTGPGMHKCTCDEGWIGDGVYFCYRSSPCTSSMHCHANASCKAMDSGKYVCVCDDGFQGNGTSCTSMDACQLNNGGCHPKANCSAGYMEEPECICPENFGGDGSTCYSSINMEIKEYSSLENLVKVLNVILPEDDVLADLNSSYTLFAPNNKAIERFQGKARPEFWKQEDNILTLQGYHIIPGAHTISQLKLLTELLNRVKTLANGLSVNISISKNTDIFVNDAKVIQGDIPAINGYIHIIDKVLEPYPISVDQPNITEFFRRHPEFSLFGKALQARGLINYLNALDDYTLFVLNNKYIERHNISLKSAKFLSLFIVPDLLMSPAIINGLTVNTIRGSRDQITFKKDGGEIYANDVLIIGPDWLTETGVIHEVDGVIRSSHRHCDVEVKKQVFGTCVPCHNAKTDSVCPAGFTHATDVSAIKTCIYKTTINSYVIQLVGCKVFCFKLVKNESCCSGYFGPDCDECPGGAATPCSDHGLCHNNGTCSCDEGFTGVSCGMCAAGWTGRDCATKSNSCDYNNGGCGNNSLCTSQSGVITCTCQPGYMGINGRDCIHPCSHLNGGCHPNADCSFKDNEVSCTCQSGYVGDGIEKCDPSPTDRCQSSDGPCKGDKSCTYMSIIGMNKTLQCMCKEDFVGNMTGTLCINRSVFEALKSLTVAKAFYQSLTNKLFYLERKDLITQLQDIRNNLTLFIPLQHSSQTLEFTTEDIKNHLVNRTIHVEPRWYYDTPQEYTFYTEAGTLMMIGDDSGFTVNGIKILHRNLQAGNGLLHIIEKPLFLSFPNTTTFNTSAKTSVLTPTTTPEDMITKKISQTSQADSDLIGPVVGAVCGALLLVIVIVLAVLIWRGKATGFMAIRKRFVRKGSTNSLSLTRIQSDQDDDLDGPESPNVKKFNNPIYNVKDDYDD